MKALRKVGILGPCLALVAGCAGKTEKPVVVWPLPPEVPRVRFVRAFASEEHLEPSGWQRFVDAITGGVSQERILQPTGLALSNDETRLYVTSPAYSTVLEFDFQERRVRKIADAEGMRPTRPFDIALDGQDNIYISDQAGKMVWVYESTGDKLLRQIGRGKLVRPTGVAVDRERGLLYAVDGANKESDHHTVEVFKTTGEHVRSIGKRGDGDGELFFPVYVTTGKRGQVVVGDSMNFRVQIFDAGGNFLSKFGQAGPGYGNFGRIKGLSYDAFGNLHVVDGEYGLVQMFNRLNKPLMHYGARAAMLEYFDMPTGIVIDSKNNIYVANFGVGRVNQYEIINTKAEDSFEGRPPPEEPPEPKPAKVEELTPASPASREKTNDSGVQ